MKHPFFTGHGPGQLAKLKVSSTGGNSSTGIFFAQKLKVSRHCFFSTCLQVDFYLFRIKIWDSNFHLKNAWGFDMNFQGLFQVYINDIANIIKLWLNFRGLFEIFCRIAKKKKHILRILKKHLCVFNLIIFLFSNELNFEKKTLIAMTATTVLCSRVPFDVCAQMIWSICMVRIWINTFLNYF